MIILPSVYKHYIASLVHSSLSQDKQNAAMSCEGMHGCTLNKLVVNFLISYLLHMQQVYLCVITVGFFKCAMNYMTQSRIRQVIPLDVRTTCDVTI